MLTERNVIIGNIKRTRSISKKLVCDDGTHVTEVVSREKPAAKLVVEPEQVRGVQLQDFATVKPELVRRRRDVVVVTLLLAVGIASLREPGEFLRWTRIGREMSGDLQHQRCDALTLWEFVEYLQNYPSLNTIY